MKKNEISEKLIVIFSENGLFVDDVTSPIINYIPDSLTFVQLIICIEESFDIELPDEYMLIENLGTLETLAERLYGLFHT